MAKFRNLGSRLPNALTDVPPGTAYNRDLAAGFGILNCTVARTVGLGASRQTHLAARYGF